MNRGLMNFPIPNGLVKLKYKLLASINPENGPYLVSSYYIVLYDMIEGPNPGRMSCPVYTLLAILNIYLRIIGSNIPRDP